MEIEPVPNYFYNQNDASDVPLEFMDKNQGNERFRGNYNMLTILREITSIANKILELHEQMKKRGNFIRELNLLNPYHEQTYCIVPLCHYVVLCNYMRMSKTLAFKFPLFRRQAYLEDTDLHAYLNLWLTIGNLVDESQAFYDNLGKLESKSETEAKDIVLHWAVNMAKALFRLRKKVHVLPEYAPLVPLIPYPPQVTACLREYFGVHARGGSWEDFLNDPKNETSDEADGEADGEDSKKKTRKRIPGQKSVYQPVENCDCASAEVAITPKRSKEWKKHQIQKCKVCIFFQKMSVLPTEEIPYETYLVSTKSENVDPDGHYCYFPKKTKKTVTKNVSEYDEYAPKKIAEVKNKYSVPKKGNDKRGKQVKPVLSVPNHRYGIITNARIINAITKAQDPNAVFQDPNHAHTTRQDYHSEILAVSTEEYCTGSDNPGSSSSDDESEDNARPPLTINPENLVEFFEQGWHNFPLAEGHGYMFPSFVKTITRYLYDMEPEDKPISIRYTKILMKTCRVLINKAFQSHPSTDLYNMRFHLQLIPEIYKETAKGMEAVYQIGLKVIAYDIPNANWVKRQMGDNYYHFVNTFIFETLTLLETAIHGVPGSCLTEWNIWLRLAALNSMKILNKLQFHISCFSLEVL